MSTTIIRQKLVISGVGGQGVLFITRILAEAAIEQGLPVLASETHGMAQRGGAVISYLKIGDFTSPLIRPGAADILICLQADVFPLHAHYLAADGIALVNAPSGAVMKDSPAGVRPVLADASEMARRIDESRNINLVLLGRAVAVIPDFFCSMDHIRAAVSRMLIRKELALESALNALETGYGL